MVLNPFLLTRTLAAERSAMATSTGVGRPRSLPSMVTDAPSGSVTSFTTPEDAGATAGSRPAVAAPGCAAPPAVAAGVAVRCTSTTAPSTAATATAATAIHVANLPPVLGDAGSGTAPGSEALAAGSALWNPCGGRCTAWPAGAGAPGRNSVAASGSSRIVSGGR